MKINLSSYKMSLQNVFKKGNASCFMCRSSKTINTLEKHLLNQCGTTRENKLTKKYSLTTKMDKNILSKYL